jgi:hypothetical protein
MLGILSFLSGFVVGTVVSWDGWDGTLKIEFPNQYAYVSNKYNHVVDKWNKLFTSSKQKT